MKILIVSDTHGNNDNFLRALKAEKPVDLLVHAGDVEGDEYFYQEKAGCPVHMVGGNNDYFSTLPREKEFAIGAQRVFLTHGNFYRVAMGYEYLVEEARSRETGIVIFGHTHRPVVEHIEGVTLVNPGSLTYPRQQGRRPSYVVATTTNLGETKFEIKYL